MIINIFEKYLSEKLFRSYQGLLYKVNSILRIYYRNLRIYDKLRIYYRNLTIVINKYYKYKYNHSN